MKTGSRKGETDRKAMRQSGQVDMLKSQHSMAMAGRFGMGFPAGRW